MSSSDHGHGIIQELGGNVDSWAPWNVTFQDVTFLANSPNDLQVYKVWEPLTLQPLSLDVAWVSLTSILVFPTCLWNAAWAPCPEAPSSSLLWGNLCPSSHSSSLATPSREPPWLQKAEPLMPFSVYFTAICLSLYGVDHLHPWTWGFGVTQAGPSTLDQMRGWEEGQIMVWKGGEPVWAALCTSVFMDGFALFFSMRWASSFRSDRWGDGACKSWTDDCNADTRQNWVSSSVPLICRDTLIFTASSH